MDLNQAVNMEEVVIGNLTHTEVLAGEIHVETMNKTGVTSNMWTQRLNTLFEDDRREDDWYIAESDSEDVASPEEDGVFDEYSLCLETLFMRRKNSSHILMIGFGVS
ncbi:hypothetical protein LINGRAPRIM_LOCUS3396 [Linum grandiflorum]